MKSPIELHTYSLQVYIVFWALKFVDQIVFKKQDPIAKEGALVTMSCIQFGLLFTSS